MINLLKVKWLEYNKSFYQKIVSWNQVIISFKGVRQYKFFNVMNINIREVKDLELLKCVGDQFV